MTYVIRMSIPMGPGSGGRTSGYVAGLAGDGRVLVADRQSGACKWPEEEVERARRMLAVIGGDAHLVRLRPRAKRPSTDASSDAGGSK